jgi:hypothetical protein
VPKHADFVKIFERFISQYGEKKGEESYYSFIKKKGYDDTKPLPKKNETKEHRCIVSGVEFKETAEAFHVEGLIATSHPDGVNDIIPKRTLESFAEQINNVVEARVMGAHHSEGITGEFFAKADVENVPAKVLKLKDGEYGLFVDTKYLMNDPGTPEQISKWKNGEFNSFSITYDTNGFLTTDFEFMNDELFRVINPETRLFGYTAASNPVNPNAVATGYGFKEFKELLNKNELEEHKMVEEVKNQDSELLEIKEEEKKKKEESEKEKSDDKKKEESESKDEKEESSDKDDEEKKKKSKDKNKEKDVEAKEFVDNVKKLIQGEVNKMEVKEKVLQQTDVVETKEIPLEFKEYMEIGEKPIELKEQFKRAGRYAEFKGINIMNAVTKRVEEREFKSFAIGANGRSLEFKGLGITTNKPTDTDYLQSAPELSDIYDPMIYNAINQQTLTWNVLAKDNYANKGNNLVQFKLKTAANVSATFYTGNSVASGNVTRTPYQTKFKKVQVGVSVDGDMIAAARGGPVGDVFSQEVMDSTMDMMAVVNLALYAEKGAETDKECLGFEYITDSAGNTSLYGYTRSTANKLAPDSAGDTYINGGSAVISMANLRSAITQAVNEGANKRNLIFFTNPIQGNMLRGKFDDSRRMLSPTDSGFGFSTDLYIDGIPVFEDKDCNTDDVFLVDLETHRVAIWIPPTLERLGKSGDQEDGFIKMYFATYNRAPRRMVQIYGNATS